MRDGTLQLFMLLQKFDLLHHYLCGHAHDAAIGILQARFDVDAKRTKLAKLRGTAGIKVSILLASLNYVLAYMLTELDTLNMLTELDTLNVAMCFMLKYY